LQLAKLILLHQVLEAYLVKFELQEDDDESRVALKRELDHLQLVSDRNARVQNLASLPEGGTQAITSLVCHQINVDCLQACSISRLWLQPQCFDASSHKTYIPSSTTSLFSLRLEHLDVLHSSEAGLRAVDAVPQQRFKLRVKELHASLKAPDELPFKFGLAWEDNAACLEHLPFEELMQSYGDASAMPRKHHQSSGMTRHVACIAARDVSVKGTIQEVATTAAPVPEGTHTFLAELLERTETDGEGLIKLGGFSAMSMPHALPMALGSVANWADNLSQLSTMQEAAQYQAFHQQSALILHLLERTETRLGVRIATEGRCSAHTV